MTVISVLKRIGRDGELSTNAKALALALLAVGRESSDPELMLACGLSRAAVQKAIQELELSGHFVRVRIHGARRFCLPKEINPTYNNNNKKNKSNRGRNNRNKVEFLAETTTTSNSTLATETASPAEAPRASREAHTTVDPVTFEVLTRAGLAPRIARDYASRLPREIAVKAVKYATARATQNPGGYLRKTLEEDWASSETLSSAATNHEVDTIGGASATGGSGRGRKYSSSKRKRSLTSPAVTNQPSMEAQEIRRVQASESRRIDEFVAANLNELSARAECLVTQADPLLRRLEIRGIITDLARKELGIDCGSTDDPARRT